MTRCWVSWICSHFVCFVSVGGSGIGLRWVRFGLVEGCEERVVGRFVGELIVVRDVSGSV